MARKIEIIYNTEYIYEYTYGIIQENPERKKLTTDDFEEEYLEVLWMLIKCFIIFFCVFLEFLISQFLFVNICYGC